jgi:hypothetical protein
MFYNLDYPKETGENGLITGIWLNASIEKGIIDFTEI